MWLKKILQKQSDYGHSPSGGGGGDLGVGSDNVMGLHGEGVFFANDGETRDDETFKKRKKKKRRPLTERRFRKEKIERNRPDVY